MPSLPWTTPMEQQCQRLRCRSRLFQSRLPNPVWISPSWGVNADGLMQQACGGGRGSVIVVGYEEEI